MRCANTVGTAAVIAAAWTDLAHANHEGGGLLQGSTDVSLLQCLHLCNHCHIRQLREREKAKYPHLAAGPNLGPTDNILDITFATQRPVAHRASQQR